MQTITILVQTEDIKDKILWFLKHLEQDGVEIISREDFNDLHSLDASQALQKFLDSKAHALSDLDVDSFSEGRKSDIDRVVEI
jgi:hypothetical protein